MSGIHDVAHAAGVSPATVSRALRGLDRVSPTTRARVLLAANQLHYVASPTATSLATGKTGVVGVVVPFLSRWFFATLIDGAEERLREADRHILLFNVGSRPGPRTRVLDKGLLAKRVDAVLVLTADLHIDELNLLDGLGVPVVSVGVDLAGWDRVGIDDFAATASAIGHLLDLGHRRIAYVGGNPGGDVRVTTSVDRLAGVLAALGDVGITPPPGYLVEGDWSVGAGQAAAAALLDLTEPPTAVLAASDEMAFGVLLEARRRHCAVPAQLSVMGIDDHEMSFTHRLTTVAQPVREQGRLAGQLLLDALAGRRPAGRRLVTVPAQLVVRHTTAVPPRGPVPVSAVPVTSVPVSSVPVSPAPDSPVPVSPVPVNAPA